jgi:hypothetical protein
MTGDDDRYLSLAELVAYSGLGLRTLNRYLVDPDQPLPHYRVGARVLVKRSEFDSWLRRVGTSPEAADQRTAARTFDDRVRAAVATVRGRR